jgi:CubicO group peptidase (beta-lactamase class C family)
MDDRLDGALHAIDTWGAERVAAAVVGPDGVRAIHGDPTVALPWASVTKLVTAWTVLMAVERGLINLDEPAGPPGATVRHLLAHASGLPFDGLTPISPPARRRIYSNTGFDRLGDLVAERAGRPLGDALGEWVLAPLGMTSTDLRGRPSEGLAGPLADLVLFSRELLRPTLIGADLARAARTVAFAGLAGVVPGVGNFDPCDWGLGMELRADKTPHWMGDAVGRASFGHFGRDGSFVWVDPDTDLALAVVEDRAFGPWSMTAWPALSTEVVAATRD